jgi:uncharacterized protein (UPF0332 family)
VNMETKDKNQLIKYRLEQARDTVQVVALLIEHNKLPAAVNRIYYGIFYSLLALGLTYDFKTSKHLQLIGWFNKEFISTHKIETEYGKILKKAFESRTSGDYDIFYEFETEDVRNLFDEMQRFVSRIQRHITEK